MPSDRPLIDRLAAWCRRKHVAAAGASVLCLGLAACGTTQHNLATQQLLESDAIDAAIAQVDFTPLAGHKVYFDAVYLQDYKGVGFVNSNYVISGLRQQILSAGCLLQETRDTADYVVEGRIGALGSDQHDVVYGLPKTNALNAVASVVASAPSLPAVPELAVAKKVASHGAAKLALFAYDRQTREPVWQSGLSLARSSSRDTWVLGAGPFQDGTIHRDKVRFAGARYPLRPWKRQREIARPDRLAAYERAAVFPGAAEAALAPQEPAHLAESAAARPLSAPDAETIKPVSAAEVVDGDAPTGTSPSADAVDVTLPSPARESVDQPLPFPEP